MRSNNCFVIGNLGGDPQERGSTKSGPVVGFNVAENVSAFDEATQTFKTVHTNWFHVTAFGSIAERAKKHLKKGDRVAVQGKMKVSRFKDKSGEERSGFEILADEVGLWKPLPSAKGSNDSDEDLPF